MTEQGGALRISYCVLCRPALITLVVSVVAMGLSARCLPGQSSATETPSAASRVTTLLPSGDVFRAPIADPREPRFHQSVVQIHGGSLASRVWLTDHGESIGLLRRENASRQSAMQFGLLVAKFAQLDLDTESNDLVNADYMIGFPLTFRRGPLTGRVSLYHVSSHLGDEYLIASNRERVNVSFETLDARLSREWGSWRVYGGGNLVVRRSPKDLLAAAAHGGVEHRGVRYGRAVFANGIVYPVAAVDISAPGSQSGGARFSAKAGVELTSNRSSGAAGRSMSVLGEYFSGPSQFGQFYRERIRFAGLALQFTL